MAATCMLADTNVVNSAKKQKRLEPICDGAWPQVSGIPNAGAHAAPYAHRTHVALEISEVVHEVQCHDEFCSAGDKGGDAKRGEVRTPSVHCQRRAPHLPNMMGCVNGLIVLKLLLLGPGRERSLVTPTQYATRTAMQCALRTSTSNTGLPRGGTP